MEDLVRLKPRPAGDGTLRVAVLRALVLGDLLAATPALRALRLGLPRAHVTLVGLPWAREFALRLSSVDAFVELPGWPGLPEQPESEPAARRRFLAAMRERRFDWALQLHGSGAIVNPLVGAWGARHTAGFREPGGWCAPADVAHYRHWPENGTEVERLLTLTDHLRLPRRGTALEFPLRPSDRAAAAPLWAGFGDAPFAIVHPGSQLPSRRWPPERFAAVADALADAGLSIVLTGADSERALTRAVAGRMRQAATDLAGRTTLWALGALVERAALVVCNDTGISHVAAALGTPSVVVSSGGDALRWAPADAGRHTVLWHETPCRPCAHAVCPYPGHPCAAGVATETVIRAARRALPALRHV